MNALQAAAATGTIAGDSAGAETLREIIATVTVRRGTKRGTVAVKIVRRLAAFMRDLPRFPEVRGESWGKVVAEDGFEPPTPGL